MALKGNQVRLEITLHWAQQCIYGAVNSEIGTNLYNAPRTKLGHEVLDVLRSLTYAGEGWVYIKPGSLIVLTTAEHVPELMRRLEALDEKARRRLEHRVRSRT